MTGGIHQCAWGDGAAGGGAGGFAEFTITATPWTSFDLTVRILTIPPPLNAAEVTAGIRHCLDEVSAVTPFTFTIIAGPADITFSFTGRTPTVPPKDMPDGQDGLAMNNVVTYNPAKYVYSAATPPAAGTHDLIAIGLHELGHLLGLGHSTDPTAAMHIPVATGLRRYGPDDVAALQKLYGGRVDQVPGWFGAVSAGVDVATADFAGTGGLDLVVAHVDDEDGPNQAYYRIGPKLDAAGRVTGTWTEPIPMGAGKIGSSVHGFGIAIGNIVGGPRPDLVMAWVDAPEGENAVFYRVGRDLDIDGRNATWNTDILVDTWVGSETDGFAVTLFDLDGDGQLELVIAWIDDPDGENAMYYKIGRNPDPTGVFQFDNHPPMQVPGHVGDSSSGLGVAITDLRGNGRPDLVFCWVDDTDEESVGYLRVGWDLLPTGVPLGGWSTEVRLAGRWGANTVDAGAALANVRGFATPDLIAVHLEDTDDDGDGNKAFHRVLTPPLPAWSFVHPLGPVDTVLPPVVPADVEHLAAAAPPPADEESADAIVVGLGLHTAGHAQDVVGAIWDKADLNEEKGSDLWDFHVSRVSDASRRPGSPLAVVFPTRTMVDMFWIDTANRVSTAQATVGVPGGNEIPPFTKAVSLNPGAVARTALGLVPGSPLAAASLDAEHVGFVVAGQTDDILGQHRFGGAWKPEQKLSGPWPGPVTAIAALTRQQEYFEVFWLDKEGGVWAAVASRDGNWRDAVRVLRPLTARPDSPLAAVSRADDQVDLYWIDRDNRVRTAYFHGPNPSNRESGWSDPFPVHKEALAAPGSGLAAVHGGEQRMHVFWESAKHDAAQALMSSWWAPAPDGQPVPWATPVQVTERAALKPGTDLAAAARTPGYVRVFFIAPGDTPAQVWWGTTT
jgi:hypothetical protein